MAEEKEGQLKSKINGPKRNSARKWIVLIILLACGAAAGFYIFVVRPKALKASGSTIGTFTVKRDNLRVGVSESGSIKAGTTIDVKSEVEGTASIVKIIPEGTIITKEDVENGKVLVELDRSKIEEDLAQRKVDIASAEASYADANEGYKIQIKQNESDITAAQLKVKFSLIDLKKYLGETVAIRVVSQLKQQSDISDFNIPSLLDANDLGGEASQRLGELNDQIKLADATLTRSQLQLEGTRKLFDANYVAALELKGDELEKQSNEIKKTQSAISMNLFELYEFPKQTEQLLSDYFEANRELERTEARARSKLAQSYAQLQSAELSFNLKKDRLEKVKRQFAACIIKAPAPGLVIYGGGEDQFSRMRRGPIQEGESVYQGQTIISLPDTSAMIVELSVHESSVIKVKKGQRAEIVVDAISDNKLYGQVLKVAQLPDQQRGWLNPDLKVYKTQVKIDGVNDFLKPGMSAKVEILIDNRKDVIVVPVQAVINQGSKRFCYAFASKDPKPVEVKIGAFNDTMAEITSGLEAGQVVMLNPPRLAESEKNAEPESEQAFAKDTDSKQPETTQQQSDPPPQQEDSKQQQGQPEFAQQGQEGQPGQQRGPRPDFAKMELTDEMVDGMMTMMEQRDPEKYKELDKIRKESPEKLKAALKKEMQDMMKKFQQGGGQGFGQGQGQGQGLGQEQGQGQGQGSGQRQRRGQGQGQGQGGQGQTRGGNQEQQGG